jgi:hypothetical protein
VADSFVGPMRSSAPAGSPTQYTDPNQIDTDPSDTGPDEARRDSWLDRSSLRPTTPRAAGTGPPLPQARRTTRRAGHCACRAVHRRSFRTPRRTSDTSGPTPRPPRGRWTSGWCARGHALAAWLGHRRIGDTARSRNSRAVADGVVTRLAPTSYAPGDEVAVYYDPDYPEFTSTGIDKAETSARRPSSQSQGCCSWPERSGSPWCVRADGPSAVADQSACGGSASGEGLGGRFLFR